MGGIMTAYATGDYVAAGFITPLMYFIGVVAVLVSAIILKKTKPFSGKPAPFVMDFRSTTFRLQRQFCFTFGRD